MSVVKPTKIFVEENEEIPFLLERMAAAEEDQIILIVPENSIIFSSLVSLSILYRKAVDIKKYIILATEDARGLHLAQKSGYIAVQKISQISTDLWEIAIERHLQLARKLRDSLKPKDEDLDPTEENNAEPVPEIQTDSIENKSGVEESKEMATKKEDEEKDEPELVDIYKRPKVLPKVVTVDGIQILAGGDIRSLNTTQVQGALDIMENKDMDSQTKQSIQVNSSFAGRDYSKTLSNQKTKNIFGIFSKKKKTPLPMDESIPKIGDDFRGSKLGAKKKRQYIPYVFAGVIASSFLVITYLVLFQMSRVNLSITLVKEERETTETILGSTDITEVDEESLSVPISFTAEEKTTLQKNGTATGKSFVGTKTKGFINIYNYTNQSIELPAGTRVTNLSTGLSYVIGTTVEVSATSVNQNVGVDNAGILIDVLVEAVDIGPQYNIEDASSNTIFTIEGFLGTSQIEGKRFSPFEGGSSEEIKTISELDVENLRKIMIPEMEQKLNNQIVNSNIAGFRLIPNSIKYTEPILLVTPKIGEPVPQDGSFTVAVELSASSMRVSNTHLQSIAEIVANKNSNSLQNSNVSGLEIVDVSNITESGVSFTLTSSSTVSELLDINELKSEISGLTSAEAKRLIDKDSRIDSFDYVFTPFFVPDFLQYVPGVDRIDISIRD